MATANDIIVAAGNKIALRNMTDTEKTYALTSLNNLISLEGAAYMVPVATQESFTLVEDDYEYTIGSSGQFDTVRPIGIISCDLRDASSVDYSLRVISHKDYRKITQKTLTGKPEKVCYFPEYPLGKIYFDCGPDYTYSATFNFWKNFTEFTDTTTTVSLPNEYKAYLVANLAVSLAEDWDRNPSKTLYQLAAESKEILSRMLASQRVTPKAGFEITSGHDIGFANIELNDTYIDGGSF